MVPCILCQNNSKEYKTIKGIIYLQCENCKSVFKHPNHYISKKAEKKRYLEHNNDIEDLRYQEFVSPIVNGITQFFSHDLQGLDFGSGTGPVIKKLLNDKGYQMALYDPFFHPNTRVLKQAYSFIACCEVIEHFHHPNKEFNLLKNLLLPNGKLFCMTELIPKNIPFEDWYYIKDPTHVFFYTEESLKWIQEHFSFSKLEIKGRLSIFNN